MLELFRNLDSAQWLGIVVLATSAIMFVLSQLAPEPEPDETTTDETTENR